MSAERSKTPLPLSRLGLIAVFVTALITSQVTASKLVGIEIPFSIPLAGSTLIVPAAAFAYAVTFFASDCYAELYGRSEATKLVNVAFAMNFVLLGLVWLAIEAPLFAPGSVEQSAFANVLGSSSRIVAGSMLAYLVSQNLDVFTFHFLRDRTEGRALWLRNLGSTATSQLVDTLIFISIGFIILGSTSLDTAAGLIVGQYLVKIGVALFDTPFVYAVVHLVRDSEVGPSVVPSD